MNLQELFKKKINEVTREKPENNPLFFPQNVLESTEPFIEIDNNSHAHACTLTCIWAC